MNRRNVLVGLGAAGIIPSAALAAPAPTQHFLTILNKIGLPVEISMELAEDLLIVHRINALRLIPHLYGTTFSIEKVVLGVDHPNPMLFFTLRTPDERDPEMNWMSAAHWPHHHRWFSAIPTIPEDARETQFIPTFRGRDARFTPTFRV